MIDLNELLFLNIFKCFFFLGVSFWCLFKLLMIW